MRGLKGELQMRGLKGEVMVYKGRATLAAGVIVAAFALTVSFSSAPATAASLSSKAKIVVMSTSPAKPTAGQTYTMRFEIMKDGAAFPMKSVACYGTVGGRL